MNNSSTTPILFPYALEEFWENMRLIMREEITRRSKQESNVAPNETQGLNYKPLLKIAEVCTFLILTTYYLYMIKDGKLKPNKIRLGVGGRGLFFWNDLQQLLPVY
jgi:hypothetical protein